MGIWPRECHHSGPSAKSHWNIGVPPIVSSQAANRMRNSSAICSAVPITPWTLPGPFVPIPTRATKLITRLFSPNARFSSTMAPQYPQPSSGPKYPSWMRNPKCSPSSDHRWSSEDPCPEMTRSRIGIAPALDPCLRFCFSSLGKPHLTPLQALPSLGSLVPAGHLGLRE